ncbi:hypothetical protein [Salmonirosea aquatica]|uniref:Neutral/alkaline non-lysosomal ceramidase N-terminal domain-containing protein n=1 Tax=Salmonirosea aquatica TaxID=2654236 RepID=A0A7C9BDI4_9BACT|nr:hypothetical protein [Cytophagaceae bacterium SJW1-29]
MRSIRLFLAVLLFLPVGLAAQGLSAGAAKRVITPDPLLPVSGGIGTPKKSLEKKGDLFVRAMVLEKGDVRVAFVSIDNLGWPSVLGDKSRALVKGIKPENILIAATHTHSAPDAYGFPNEKGESFADLKYLDWCVQQTADAINEAVQKLEPAALKVTTGEAKGKIAYNYYAPDLYDPRCGVIQAIASGGTRKGQILATLVNYAVHPEVLGSGQGILSPDLCGPLYDQIEAKVGGVAMFINGAQGGMVTADVRRDNGQEANTWEECHRIGELLADEALRLVAAAPVLDNPDLYCTSRRLEFPIDSDIMKYILQKSPLNYKMAKPNTVATQLNLVNVGPAQILTIPGEALPNIGYYVKRNMPTEHPFLFGLTNDAFGYMLTKVDFTSFKRYDYVSRTSLGEMTGEIYMEKALQLVKESPKPTH